MFKIPLQWHTKQVLKNSRISHLYFNIQKEATKTRWCSCRQMNIALCDCLCMWEGIELHEEVKEYMKLVANQKEPVFPNNMHWIYGVLNEDMSPNIKKNII